MKKIFIYLFMTLLVTNVVTLNTNIKVKAEEVKSCAAFEVDWINDDGSFTYAGCKNSLNEAKTLMNSDPLEKGINGREDYVIRHSASKSASKIVAMQGGVAYSFPYRSSANGSDAAITLAVFQYPNKNINDKDKDPRSPYITTFEEMNYFDTLSFDPATQTGDALVMCYGFKGYVRIDDIDLVPTKYLKNGLKIGFGGNTFNNYSSAYISNNPVYLRLTKNYYTVEKNPKGGYLDLIYHYNSYGSRSSNAFGILTYTIGKAADFMQEGIKYYSSDGINFYTDINEKNDYAGTYYNYYQFVPLRATSNIKASDFDKFLEYKGVNKSSELYGTGQLFLNAEKKYGINAMIMFGIACNETAYGTKVIKKSGVNGVYSTHNLFNTNAVDSNIGLADVFDSVEQCINQTASFWFASYIDLKDPRFYGSHLGNKGAGINVRYATDPVWGMKASMNAYLLDKVANNFNGNLSNTDKDTLGVITTFNASLLKEAKSNSKEYKKAYYGYSYMKDFTVIIEDFEKDFVKVVSTNPISADRGTMLMGADIQRDTSYNRDSSYFYVRKNDLKQVTNTTVSATGEYIHNISEIKISDDSLLIKGSAYTPGVIVPSSLISTKVEMYKGTLYANTYNASMTVNGDVIDFEVIIPLADLGFGTYSFKVSTAYTGYSNFNGSFDVVYNDYIEPKTINDKVYKLVYSDELTRLDVKGIDSESLTVRGGIEKFELKDNEIEISGIGYFDKVNFDNPDLISYELIFDDVNSNFIAVYYLDMFEFDASTDMYNYKYIGFSGKVNISDIPNGDYKVFVNIKNGTKEKQFAVSLRNNQLLTGKSDDRNYSLIAKRSKSYRVELSLNNSIIDYSQIKVPTSYMSRFIFGGIVIENNILKIIEPCSFIRYIDYKNNSEVDFSIILFNTSNGKQYFYNFSNKACEFDYDANNSFDNLVNYGCFDGESIDLSRVEKGIYSIFIKNTNKPYTDVFNMNTARKIDVSTSKYHVFTNDINNVCLQVK